MSADSKTKIAAWVTIAASILTLLATSGKDAFAVIGGLPMLLRAFADGLPLGMWSFLLSATLAGGVHWWIRTWHGRSLLFEGAIILLAMAVTITQAALGDHNASSGALVSALWVGLLAGILGLYVSRMLLAARGEPRP